jgi:hypothetical protein
MRGLTAAEHAALSHMVMPHRIRLPTLAETAVLRDLEEARRVKIDWNLMRWVITPGGREALRLSALLLANRGVSA